MAFYTSRVDDAGNEIERRSLTTSLGAKPKTVIRAMSACVSAKLVSSCKSTCSSQRSKRLRFDYGDSDSAGDSGGDDHFSLLTSGDEGDIVPPLDIRSELSYPTEPPLHSLTYPKKFETAKIVLKPDKAYEKWLSDKRQAKLNEATRRKREEESRRRDQEERKRLAEEKYRKWLEQKTQTTTAYVKPKKPKKPIARAESPQSKTPTPTPTPIVVQHSKSETDAMKQQRLEEWEHKKRRQEEKRRLLVKKAEEDRARMVAQHKEQTAGAWERWMQKNKNRPKPVPLNQGFLTLRGTVSDIFINPNEWRTD